MPAAPGRQPLRRAPILAYSLTELLDDPMVAQVIKSDGVDRRTVELLFERHRLPCPKIAIAPQLRALKLPSE